MSVPAWLRRGSSFAKNTFGGSRRLRRGFAACAVVLAAGGLVLFRAPHDGALAVIPPVIANPRIDEPQILPQVSLADPGPNAVTFSGPGAHGTLALSQNKVLSGTRQPLFAELQIQADKDATQAAHAPLSLVVVLDTSGSMEGEKIEEAKASVVKLIRRMNDADELAVIRYSDDATTVVPLGKVSDVRARAIARVQELTADGGTAIPRGLEKGLAQLGESNRDRVRRVILVSDGLDSTRAQAERIATNSFEHGIVISSLGIGLDFDERYMSSVAQRGHGNFGFVKDAPALATFLERELEETAKTVVENATVRVTLPAGVTFRRASGADARTIGDREIELKLGSLFAGDERRVVVEMDAFLDGNAASKQPFAAHAAWDRVGGAHADIDVSTLSIAATSDRVEVEKSRNPSVFASAASVTASRREMEAADAYNRGDIGKADALVEANVRDLKAAASTAPAPVATALMAQSGSYEQARRGFHSYSAASPEGKALAKSIVQDDSANMTRAVKK